jgi:dCMP deaminase
MIYSIGIKEVIYLKSYAQYKGIEFDEGVEFLKQFDVSVHQYAGNLENVTHMI